MVRIAGGCILASFALSPCWAGGSNVGNHTDESEDSPEVFATFRTTHMGFSTHLEEASGNSSDPEFEDFAEASGPSYNAPEARACARISAATYCRKGGPGVRDVKLVESGGELATVGRWRGHCIAAFRGTDNLESAVEDIISLALAPLPDCQGCMVGEGILDAYHRVAGGIKDALHSLGCTQVSVTGHSLGANMAILALYDLAKSGFQLGTSYTFGQSRIGNIAFHDAWEAAVHTQVFRFVHGEDPIVRVGPLGSSTHEGTEIYLKGASVEHDHSCYLNIRFKRDILLSGRICGTPCKMYP